MNSYESESREIQRAAKAARALNRQGMRLVGPDGRLLEQRSQVAHYHIMYDSVVHYAVVFETEHLAFKEVKRMGEASEPNTEWYDDGPVLIETRLPERTGLHKVLLQVVVCWLSRCRTEATEVRVVKDVPS